MSVRQLKGRKHIKLIRKQAMRLWRDAFYQKDLWKECLKTAIENHRLQVESEIISKKIQKQLSFQSFQCDTNGWIG